MKVFLSATTSGLPVKVREETVAQCEPRYFLETFYSGERKCLKVMNEVGIDNFLLDSGAFSFMNGAAITTKSMEEYIKRYIRFIAQYKVRNYFEIDIDVIFGLDYVEYWRKRIESFTGIKCIPVWHKSRGVEYWKRMCNEYKFIAIGGFAINDIKKQEYEKIKPLLEYARIRDVKVHGLGFTKAKILNEYDFYSVDSSSWLTAAARGQVMYMFHNGQLSQRKINAEGQKVNIGKLAAHNMREWVKYQKFMEDIRK